MQQDNIISTESTLTLGGLTSKIPTTDVHYKAVIRNI